MTEPTTSDVYERVIALYAAVIWLARVTVALCFLVVINLIGKAIIFGRVMGLLNRVETLLRIVEKHGGMTDQKTEELKTQTARAVVEVKTAVRRGVAEMKSEVPARVAEELAKSAPPGAIVIPATPPGAAPGSS